MFDWKSRFRNKAFIISLVSAILLAVQTILQPFGIIIDNTYIMGVVNSILAILMILGIVIDPSSPGIFDLSKYVAKHTYKIKKDKKDVRDFKFAHSVQTPKKIDLRQNCPEVFDQGTLGSCTANAGVSAMMYQKPGTLLSRLYMYYKERELEGTIFEDSGASIRDECKVAATGVCEEVYYPYNIDKFTDTPSRDADANSKFHTIRYYRSLKTLNDIKQALTLGTPVLIGMTVYQSFEGQQVAATGRMTMPRFSEAKLGGHAVMVVGYDDDQKVLIVRNSWGSLGATKAISICRIRM